jgi:hypothetical protein
LGTRKELGNEKTREELGTRKELGNERIKE